MVLYARGTRHFRRACRAQQGRSTVTDSEGWFEFPGLTPGFYQTRVAVKQFDQAIRLTSSAEAEMELDEGKTAQIDFGVVNFTRLTGTVV